MNFQLFVHRYEIHTENGNGNMRVSNFVPRIRKTFELRHIRTVSHYLLHVLF